MTDFQRIPVTSLIPDPDNTRKDLQPTDPEYVRIRASIEAFQFLDPIVFETDTRDIIGGHQRLKVLHEQGVTELFVVALGAYSLAFPEANLRKLSDSEKRAARIALNKAVGDWDYDKLVMSLNALKVDDFDINLTGFGDKELVQFMADQKKKAAKGDNHETPEDLTTTIKRGDIIQLGRHRIMCGDSANPEDLAVLMDGKRADASITSPPYNAGKNYDTHDDEQPLEEYFANMQAIASNCYAFLHDGRLFAWNVGVSPKSRPHQHVALLEEIGFAVFRNIVWKKCGAQIPLWQNSVKNPVARNYRPNYQFEMIYMMLKGELQLGGPTSMPDELQSDVWDISQFSAGGHNHPAAFPVPLAIAAIMVMTCEGELLLEPFLGSGSTLIACEQTGRTCYGMEIAPKYCEEVCRRWEKETGKVRKLIQKPKPAKEATAPPQKVAPVKKKTTAAKK